MAGGKNYDDIFTNLIETTSAASMAMGAAIGDSDTKITDSLAESLKYLDNSYKEAQAYLTPFRVAGQNSIQTLNNFIGVNGQAAQQQALSSIMQPAMNAMVGFGPQIAQQAMGMFFGAAGVPQQVANQTINQATYQAIQSHPAMAEANRAATLKQLQDLQSKPATSRYQEQLQMLDQNINDYTQRMMETRGPDSDWAKQMNPAAPQTATQKWLGQTNQPTPANQAFDPKADANLQALTAQRDKLQADLKTKYNGDLNAAMKAEPAMYDPNYMINQYQSQFDGYNRVLNESNSGVGVTGNVQGASSIAGQAVPGSAGGGNDLSAPFEQFMSQYGKLMNQDPAQFSNNLISTLMDPVTGAVTQATQGFTDSMMKYGVKAIDQSAASKGMLNSGRTIAEAQDYGMGVAGQYIIPAIQNVLGMGMQAGTGQASNILQSGTNLRGQQTSLANQYMSSMSQGGTQLAGQSINSTQNALSNLLAQATGAATTSAGLAGQQGTTGSGYGMQVGQYKADNALLRGKVHSDALNTIGQLQFLQDMGPYVNQLGAIPGISSGGGTVGGGQAGAQHAAAEQGAQNYLRSGGGGGGAYTGPGYNTGAGQNFGWVNPGPQGQMATLPSGQQGWGATYTPSAP